jgi:cob(I)alamin adenosyltransferase
MINTGDGKGKTTAAFGAAMRMLGHGGRVAMVQFIKSGREYGELKAAAKFGSDFEIHTLGRGFVRPDKGPVPEENKLAARDALEKAKSLLADGKFDLVILDEITYLPKLGFATVEEILDAVRSRSEKVHVILTGRGADPKLIEAADTVTEFREKKHPYKHGIKARKGVEF